MKALKYVTPLLLFSFVLSACDQNGDENNNEQQRAREVVVEVLDVDPRAFEERVRVTGTVEALEDATISAEVSGRVHTIAERGTTVERGSELVSLDDRVVRSSLEMARANFEFAEDALARQEPLLRDSIISTLEFNQARSQRDQAKSQLEQAEKQLGDSRIQAPFRGRVEERMVKSGELVNPGMPVLRLVNTDKVRINAGVPERYINDIDEGAAVTISLGTYGREELKSTIRYAGSVIVPETRTFPVEVVMENTGRLLKPEMTVNLSIVRDFWDDALVVPRTALVRDEDGLRLFVTTEDENGRKKAEARRVRTGAASGSLIVIEEGIEPGDQVIVTGQTNVSDGDLLRIQNTRTYDHYK
ncbi:efflux RND transporter periplasmic adaptor subunit [Natronogracilivirga saccharolytica]|uniref:Efflux RND transporter periplasmic adaptor subunit n=1 Tax=Natronogracilivirga saccharolytica TaxID=2812953 RepID=A0A8J7SAR2_9BACT|nr:efflux RND transporter periplasmic adaptor subunit [Natronogracilivirga saccharolytica]MBP3193598.1 efflux RND transporter periplasmic adaptor subunit [Natronogracilivirga saccharolytica]